MEFWMWITGAAVILGTVVFAAFLGIKTPKVLSMSVKTPTYVKLFTIYGVPSIRYYRVGDAVYQSGLIYPAGIYKITDITLLNSGKEPSYEVWGTLILPGVLSDCVGLQVCGEINRKSQCIHYWHHGPERPAYDKNHVHPEPPKQPSNLVAYTGNKCSMQPVQPIMTYQNTSSRWH